LFRPFLRFLPFPTFVAFPRFARSWGSFFPFSHLPTFLDVEQPMRPPDPQREPSLPQSPYPLFFSFFFFHSVFLRIFPCCPLWSLPSWTPSCVLCQPSSAFFPLADYCSFRARQSCSTSGSSFPPIFFPFPSGCALLLQRPTLILFLPNPRRSAFLLYSPLLVFLLVTLSPPITPNYGP